MRNKLKRCFYVKDLFSNYYRAFKQIFHYTLFAILFSNRWEFLSNDPDKYSRQRIVDKKKFNSNTIVGNAFRKD